MHATLYSVCKIVTDPTSTSSSSQTKKRGLSTELEYRWYKIHSYKNHHRTAEVPWQGVEGGIPATYTHNCKRNRTPIAYMKSRSRTFSGELACCKGSESTLIPAWKQVHHVKVSGLIVHTHWQLLTIEQEKKVLRTTGSIFTIMSDKIHNVN